MENILIFLRHAKTQIDKEIPIAEWDLSKEGYKQAESIKNINELQDVDIIISSNEKKAYLTVKPLAEKLGKGIIKVKELGEIYRGDAGALSKKEYEQMKVKIFQDLNFTDLGWETANHALNRFKEAVENINKKYNNKKILISSHGTVMTLYFVYLQDKLDNLMERWKSLEFGAYGIVKNKKVIKDIV